MRNVSFSEELAGWAQWLILQVFLWSFQKKGIMRYEYTKPLEEIQIH